MTGINGNGWTKIVIRILAGIIATGVATILLTHETKINANDKEARQERQVMTEKLHKVEREVYDKLSQIQKEQGINHTEILVAIERLKARPPQ